MNNTNIPAYLAPSGTVLAFVELDVCLEPDEIPAYAEAAGVTAYVLLNEGPAGGWPFVRFVGTPTAIADLMRFYAFA